MHLTTNDKLQIFLNNASVYFGILFGIADILFIPLFGLNCDFSSLPLACFPLAQTTGNIVSTAKTGQHVNDSPVFVHAYQYRVDDQSYQTNAFTEAQQLPVGTSIIVEYLPVRPTIARIQGMRNAPIPVANLLVTYLLLSFGPVILYLNWRRTRGVMALVTNPFLTRGICQQFEDLHKKNEDGEKFYRAHYQYEVSGRIYTLTITTTVVSEYGVDEPLVAQLDQPQHAQLARELPEFIWRRLQSPPQ